MNMYAGNKNVIAIVRELILLAPLKSNKEIARELKCGGNFQHLNHHEVEKIVNENRIVNLPDGYNGHFARFYAVPVEYDGDLVKLRCAEKGKEYMFTWRHRNDVIKALEVKP